MLQISSMPRIRIALVDNHEVVRIGLHKYLEMVPRFEVVGEASNGNAALELAAQLNPNVMIVDISMDGMDGFEVTEELSNRYPSIRALIASAHRGEEMVHRAIQAGAHGYVSKDDSLDEYTRAIETITGGGKYFGKSVANAVFKPSVLERLTPREIQVLTLIAEGHCNKAIARKFGIGDRGVETHRFSLRGKLKISSEAGLTVFAIRHGLINPDDWPANEDE